MNKTPSILVDTGFEVDQNGALTEIVMPSVVATLDQPKKIVFNGTTINYIPSTADALEECSAPYATSIPANAFIYYTKLASVNLQSLLSLVNTGSSASGAFYGCTALTSVTLPSLTRISCGVSQNTSSGAFYGCTALTAISLDALTEITLAGNNWGSSTIGAFYGCTALTTVTLPSLTAINSSSNGGTIGAFYGCTALTSVTLPSLTICTDSSSNRATFGNCTSLETVQLGSEGRAVTSLGAYMFKNCTQSNLTITIYTQGGAALAGEPWGATNATIEYEEA